MSRPPVAFGDAAAELADVLRTALASRAEPYAAGVTVGTRIPTDRRPLEQPPPHVVIRQDGPGAVQERVTSRVTLRAAIWHRTDDDAFDLAQLVHALAANHQGGPVIRSITGAMSPYVTPDPDTSEPLASFTMTANLRARVI